MADFKKLEVEIHQICTQNQQDMKNLQKEQQDTERELMQFKTSVQETNRLFMAEFEIVKKALGIQPPTAPVLRAKL